VISRRVPSRTTSTVGDDPAARADDI